MELNEQHTEPKSIAAYLRPPIRPSPQPKARHSNSERADLIGFFTEQINLSRRGTKYNPLSFRAIGVKLAHLNESDLYYLKSICIDAEKRGVPFSKKFFGSLKPHVAN